MWISSRTPEGMPNECPVCGKSVCIEPSLLFSDAPCPHCGCLLWFVRLPEQTLMFESKESELHEHVLETVAENLGIGKEEVRNARSWSDDLGADSLDIVELVMELEGSFDLYLPE